MRWRCDRRRFDGWSISAQGHKVRLRDRTNRSRAAARPAEGRYRCLQALLCAWSRGTCVPATGSRSTSGVLKRVVDFDDPDALLILCQSEAAVAGVTWIVAE